MSQINQAKEFFEKKVSESSDPRLALFNEIVEFMEAISLNEYDRADSTMERIIRESQGDLFREVGKVTRKLHDSITSFRDAIDPKMREIATTEVPNAVDKLQLVILKTEEAANLTMGIVEKYFTDIETLKEKIATIEGPSETVDYLKAFQVRLEEDMTTILTTQSFQDLTGQTIKKVIKLVTEIEKEMVKLIQTFGVKMDVPVTHKEEEVMEFASDGLEQVSQSDVDDLLKDFGF